MVVSTLFRTNPAVKPVHTFKWFLFIYFLRLDFVYSIIFLLIVAVSIVSIDWSNWLSSFSKEKMNSVANTHLIYFTQKKFAKALVLCIKTLLFQLRRCYFNQQFLIFQSKQINFSLQQLPMKMFALNIKLEIRMKFYRMKEVIINPL